MDEVTDIIHELTKKRAMKTKLYKYECFSPSGCPETSHRKGFQEETKKSFFSRSAKLLTKANKSYHS
jgi:hypothetical protein